MAAINYRSKNMDKRCKLARARSDITVLCSCIRHISLTMPLMSTNRDWQIQCEEMTPQWTTILPRVQGECIHIYSKIPELACNELVSFFTYFFFFIHYFVFSPFFIFEEKVINRNSNRSPFLPFRFLSFKDLF